jgi:hypothetical protein
MILPTAIFNIFIKALNTSPYYMKGKEVRNMMDEMKQDHIVMQNGSVMMVRTGEMSPLDEEITLPGGPKVKRDGTVMMPDGSTRMMAEGERILTQSEGAPTSPENMTDRQFKENMEDEELRDEIE